MRIPTRATRILVKLAGLHRDQRGSISIVSLFALMLLVLVLGMVINSGQQVDQKVKMQNAADAATYSGGVVIARGMNSLSFTNHLLCDVFALTAFMREARDRSSESLTPEILDNWAAIGPVFQQAQFPKFQRLGVAISDKVPLEREMVRTYSEWGAAASELILPVMEDILANRRIPEFQRALVQTTPNLVQVAADQVARRHGAAWPRPVELRGVMWRSFAEPAGGMSEQQRRTLPVVDPVMDTVPNLERYADRARQQRRRLAHRYLHDWNNEMIRAFDYYGKMSQFGNLWRIFTCGQLKRLLEVEYPNTNLLFQIRTRPDEITDRNGHLEENFMFVGVVYREQMEDRIAGVFENPIRADTTAYAQIMVYVPRRRLVKAYLSDNPSEEGGPPLGGVPGESVNLPVPETDQPPATEDENSDDEPPWEVVRQSGSRHPTHWDLLNQNWSMQMVPATARGLPQILSTAPGGDIATGKVPELGGMTEQDMEWLSNH